MSLRHGAYCGAFEYWFVLPPIKVIKLTNMRPTNRYPPPGKAVVRLCVPGYGDIKGVLVLLCSCHRYVPRLLVP